MVESAKGYDMAKRQKTFYLNDEICEMIEAHEAATGASFTKIITAAILKYFFSTPPGPHQHWMSQAVALEKGQCSLADIPIFVCDLEIEHATEGIRIAMSQKLPQDDPKLIVDRVNLRDFTQLKDHWTHNVKNSKRPLDAVLRHTRSHSGRPMSDIE